MVTTFDSSCMLIFLMLTSDFEDACSMKLESVSKEEAVSGNFDADAGMSLYPNLHFMQE